MVTPIRSPRVRAARSLAKRALRERSRLFLAEGPQAVQEALGHGTGGRAALTELFVTGAARSRHAALGEAATRTGAPVHTLSGDVMAELPPPAPPPGPPAVCRFIDL